VDAPRLLIPVLMLLLTGGHGRTTSQQSRHATTRQVQFFNGCGPIEDDPYFWLCCRSSKTGYQCDWQVVCGLDAVWASRVNVLNGTKLRSRRVLAHNRSYSSLHIRRMHSMECGYPLPSRRAQSHPCRAAGPRQSPPQVLPPRLGTTPGTLSLTSPLVHFHGRTK